MTEARLTFHRLGVVHWSLGERAHDHATQAWQLRIGVDRNLDFTHAGRQGRARCLLVAPHVRHSIESEGVGVSFLVEPGTEGAPFRAVGAPIEVIDGRLGDRIVAIAGRQSHTIEDDVAQRMEVFRELGLAGAAADSRVAKS